MKIRLLFVLSAAALLLLAGCAGTLNEAGLKDASSSAAPPLGKISAGTVYYKPALYGTGITRWTMVGDAIELNPDENLVKFKENFLQKVKKDLEKKGFSLVEAGKNTGAGVFVEMRIAARKNVPVLMASSGAIRWYVFHPSLKSPLEIYNWDMGDIFGMGELNDEKVEGIAQKTADDFARIFGK